MAIRKTGTAVKKNAFITNVYKGNAYTENGALSNSTTGSSLVDQFGKSGSHRGRDVNVVFAEQANIWGEDKLSSLRFAFYLRLITRKIKGFVTSEKVQSGQGAKDESFKRLLWVAKYHPDVFYKNLWLIPVVGTWKDLFTLVEMDKTLKTDTLDVNHVYELMQKGINDEYNRALVQKFMPQIKASNKCKTSRAKTLNDIAKGFAKFAGWSPKEYRQFKSTGNAHRFQRVIAAKLYDQLNFNEIPGKALFNLVKGDFLKTHGLEKKYMAWLEKQPVAKFTGYVYELLDKVIKSTGGWGYASSANKLSLIEKSTIDKQFLGLIDLAKKNGTGFDGNVWCALDTSGSMGTVVAGKTSALNIGMSLGLYFSELNTGAFHRHVIMFDSTSRVLELKGDSFVDKALQLPMNAMGSTNFQSVIDEIIRIRRTRPEVPVEDFPTTLLVVSDMQFNPSGSSTKTNYEMAMKKLAAVGLPPIKMIWWNCVGRGSEVPSTMDDLGTYLVSGFDGSIITLLTNGEKVVDERTGKTREKTMLEKVNDALTQEVLLQVTL